MTDEQLDEIDRKVELVLLDCFAYLDLGNPAIPEAIHNCKNDLIEIIDSFMEKTKE